MSIPQAGHNSQNRQQDIQALVARYADSHEESQKLNDERGKIREKAADLGLDTKAFQDQVKRSLQDLKKREGYDESAKEVAEAIGKMNPSELWAHVFERAERIEQERAERKTAREKEKSKADEFKAAPERKPKAGKSVKTSSVGKAQSEAYLEAHGDSEAA